MKFSLFVLSKRCFQTGRANLTGFYEKKKKRQMRDKSEKNCQQELDRRTGDTLTGFYEKQCEMRRCETVRKTDAVMRSVWFVLLRFVKQIEVLTEQTATTTHEGKRENRTWKAVMWSSMGRCILLGFNMAKV